MDYYSFESYDITHLVDQYKNTPLEEVFQNHKIIKNKMGEFMEIIWEPSDLPNKLNLRYAKKRILKNLKTVYYIGEKIEKKLYKKGIRNLFDLRTNLKYNTSVNEFLTYIKNKDFKNLIKNRYVCDIDIAFCFNIEDFLFLDIETLGLYDSPMIIVGIGLYHNSVYKIHQLFARNLEDEIAICEHLRIEVLPKFKSFVTYNGKSFDIPYIANRFLYYFDENPMISEEDTPYKQVNTKYHHIDLYHNCRRKYKGCFDSYTLSNMEMKLLKWKRENDLPSNMVGTCYRKYKKDPKRYVGLIKECIDHNYFDIYSLPLIFNKLLE